MSSDPEPAPPCETLGTSESKRGADSLERAVDRVGPRVTMGLLLLASLVYNAWLMRHGNVVEDEGWLLQCAMRVAAGEVPHADFLTIYPAGRYYVFAAVLSLADWELGAARMTWAVLRTATVVLTFALTRRLAGGSLLPALAAAACTLLVPGPWHKTFYALVPLATLVPFARWHENRNGAWLVVAGTCAAVGTWVRQDVGMVALLLAVFGVALAEKSPSRHLRTLLLPAFAVHAVLLGAFAVRVSPSELLRQVVGGAVEAGPPSAHLLGAVLRFDLPGLAPEPGAVVAALCLLPLALSLPVLAATTVRLTRGGSDARCVLFWCVAGWCALASNQVLRADPLVRFLQAGPSTYALAFGLLAVAARRAASRGATSRGVRTALTVVTACLPAALLAFVVGVPGNRALLVEYTGTFEVATQRTTPFDARGSTIFMARGEVERMGRLVEFLRASTTSEDRIVVLGRPASLHYLADRRSPTSVVRVTARTRQPERVRPTRRAIEEGECRYVVASTYFFGQADPEWLELLTRTCRPVLRVDPFIVYEPLSHVRRAAP